MNKPSPRRRALLAALAAATAALIASTAFVINAWTGGRGGGAGDFGEAPATSAPVAPNAPAETDQGGTDLSDGTAAVAKEPEPIGLSLPRLDVAATVDPVGVDENSEVQIPVDPKRVGWYRFSPAPGAAEGSSVIVGHVDSDGRGLGVLVALNDVRKGDRVTVGRADGSTVEYRITSRRTVGKQDLAASGVFLRDGPAVLTMITCAGPYLPDKGGYQNNLLVTAAEVKR
ncbi:class F sortase [Streptomyces sp. NPDC005047]